MTGLVPEIIKIGTYAKGKAITLWKIARIKKFDSIPKNCKKIIRPYPMITEETAIGTSGTNRTKIPFWSFLFKRKNNAQVKATITDKLAEKIAVITESFIATYKFLFNKTFVKFFI